LSPSATVNTQERRE